MDIANVHRAYKNTLRGRGQFRAASVRFAIDQTKNLNQLMEELYNGTYYPQTYVNFTLYEPVERDINAPRYRDKIVQHMVNNVIS